LDAIRYPFRRQKDETIQDIQDGTEYQKFAILETFGNLSFVFNTDGVRVFKGKPANLWPIYLAINELPPQVRYALFVL